MYIVDDPTLALIARFLGDVAPEGRADEEFFRRQFSAIEAYVERFPEDQRDARALEWIETNAMHYRQQWQKQTAISTLARRRCPDCPLAGGSQEKPCAIHRRWLKLLERYAADELSSPEYVEMSLALLNTHKSWLKVTRCHEFSESGSATALFAG
ncbi:MAG: hypothetical protein AW11_00656 [Candidatus Accumulibacter regalis]|jgi:hypothetical protein|uniref:Uncharacterized protein n=1 Tax=Accumulibacter regalis TaxID=522306 RepID=A0A011QN97_ACCRE|nr:MULTISPECIES: hypothetical protein [unclassified Candidatus Accumulibacter]EXI90797.1 MAG: hypothetical protein AW11_00656 [Candidatus Accumulibacter regalis]MQM35660.1 hypothetical protein [Candidatus Accumulibacter phosphatis]MBL8366589.1 hypothetical protein [Accumulibacter sp.]MBN8514409.1 hypothetical protein [Accumulibacter sp.]MBO3701030.1 hypothetical protein [Accumulibacter sp.]